MGTTCFLRVSSLLKIIYEPATINAAPIKVVNLRASPNIKYPAVAAKTKDKYYIGVTRPVSAMRKDCVSNIFA